MNITVNNNAKTFIWNTIGSMCSAATSFILLIFVTRICGSIDAGVFALGFANAQLMLTIGRFGMRAYQATDVKFTTKFSTYLTSRIITCTFMLLISIVYIIWSGQSVIKGIILFSICSIKMVDALEDVFHGLFQQNGSMDIAGKYLTIRNCITIFSFAIILIFTKDLLITCIITGIISIISCCIINIPMMKKIVKINKDFSKKELLTLFVNCLPLFIGSFLSLYVYNVPKYMIDRYLTSDIQTFYNILFMPAFVINLFSEFIFKPLLTDLALKWEQNQIKIFVNYIFKLMLGIFLITVIVISTGYLFGNQLLSIIYGVDLNEYRIELILLLCSGGFGAGVYFLFNTLTAMRQQVSLLIGYTTVALLISILSPILVRNYNIMGAAVSCFAASIILFIIFILVLFVSIHKRVNSISIRNI